MKKISKYFLAFLLLVWGCGDEPAKRMNGHAYFPLQTGFYQIYDVEENNYYEIEPDELLTYELKVEVVDSFQNLAGGYTFVIHRSTRPTSNDSWEALDTWSVHVDDDQVVLSEGNTPYVRLVFPLTPDRAWNGNALNAQEEDVYEILSVGTSYRLENELEFDNAVIVEQEDELNLLLRDQREEVYAPNVGLIFKKSVVINYCDEGPCVGQEVIKDGREFYQVLKSYGQN